MHTWAGFARPLDRIGQPENAARATLQMPATSFNSSLWRLVPVFRNTLWRWVLTVACETPSIPAIALMPVTLRISGREGLGAQSLDTLTDVEFRGQGLFVKLAQVVFARCEEEGLA